MKISIAIPTYKRPDEIQKCVASIVAQTLPPAEVLIIDDDELPEELVEKIKQQIESIGASFIYHKKNHTLETRGTSTSRRIALKTATHDVLIIDDDIVLDADCLKWLAHAFQSDSTGKLIATGGTIRNSRKKSAFEKLFNRIFFLGSVGWDVTDWAFQTWDEQCETRQTAHYAHGGFSLYNRIAASQIDFPVMAGGRTALEDVYFARHAKNLGWHYIIEPRATCQHFHSSSGRDKNYQIGLQESKNRKVIFKNLCPQTLGNRLIFSWANVGWILRQFMAGHFAKGWGMVTGLFA
ncbi:MAG: glycosyltransferase family A protein [Patescibacteria group bacterium]